MRIVADNTIPFLKGIIEPLGEVRYLASGQFTAKAVKEADVLIVRSVDKCTREILEGSHVKLITTATIGFDHIDTEYCEEAGIAWKNAPGCNARSVGEYIIACLVVYSMRTNEVLQGKTIGIVGAGHVGSKVEALCKVLGMRVLINDPPRAEKEGSDGFVPLDRIAAESDIITFHTPLTKSGAYPTWHLASDTFLKKLRKIPLLINASRGAVFDTEAFRQCRGIDALIVDCWENEPDISRELLNETIIATPHIAGFSADGKANATRMCLEEISRFFDVAIPRIGEVLPPAPTEPVIDLNDFSDKRVEHAILHSFNPVPVDENLRAHPEKFEWLRSHYTHPREFSAYIIKNGTQEERTLLQSLGFR